MYKQGDWVKITKGILRGQVGKISVCKLNCIYFIGKEDNQQASEFSLSSYGPFMADEIELLDLQFQ